MRYILFKIHSKQNICCLILPTISDRIPLVSFEASTVTQNIPEDVRLADTYFRKARPIDLLIGSSVFWDLICVGQIKLGNNNPTLQKTQVGWVVAGPCFPQHPSISSLSYFIRESHYTLEEQVFKFWHLEECRLTACVKNVKTRFISYFILYWESVSMYYNLYIFKIAKLFWFYTLKVEDN